MIRRLALVFGVVVAGTLSAWPVAPAPSPEAFLARRAAGPRWIDGTPAILAGREEAKRLLPHAPDAGRTLRRGAAPKAPGAIEEFWIVDLTNFFITGELYLNEDKYQTYAELVRVSAHAYVYLELGAYVDDSLLDELLWEFDTSIVPAADALFGPRPDALDGDPRVSILIAEFVGGGSFGVAVAGYFDDANQYTTPEARFAELGYSNEREMLYINQDFVEMDPWTGGVSRVLLGLMAHEYQHLLQWGRDVDEALWLNEGFSNYAAIHAGFPEVVEDHTSSFAVNPTISLTEWTNELEDYGAVTYFLLYLAEHYGGPGAIKAISDDPANGAHAVDAYLRAHHGKTFREVFRDWTLANVFDDPSGRYGYPETEATPAYYRVLFELFDLPIFFTSRYQSMSVPRTGQWLPPWSADHYLLQRDGAQQGLPVRVQVDGAPGSLFTAHLGGLARIGDPYGWGWYSYGRTHDARILLDRDMAGEIGVPTGDAYITLVVRNEMPYGDVIARPTDTYEYEVGPGDATPVVDILPPQPILDLVATAKDTWITLTWTAPGDDGKLGLAVDYDLRWSTAPIAAASFAKLVPVAGVTFPGPPGTAETFVYTRGEPLTPYWFAMTTRDDAGNRSPLSNVASVTTGARDEMAPAAIDDVSATALPNGQTLVQWTMPGDDGALGQADHCEIRWSTEPIDEANYRWAWIAARPSAGPPGTTETLPLDVDPSPGIYLVITAWDEAGNRSPLSNPVYLSPPVAVWSVY